MQAAAEISAAEAAAASATATQIQARNSQAPRFAPDFSAYARRQARVILDAQGLDGERLLARGSLRILTTLDLALQERADCLLQLHLGQLAAEQQPAPPCIDAELLAPALAMAQPPQEAALVLLDLRNGELLAMHGDATSLRFPPGPLLQPFVYFEAFRSGRTAADMLLDIPLELPGAIEGLIYTPSNADGHYRGPLSLREAMSAGLLPPAVQLASELRLETILARARSLGLVSLDDNASAGLSLLERGGEVSMLDLAYTYSLFATQGEQRGLQQEPTATTTRGARSARCAAHRGRAGTAAVAGTAHRRCELQRSTGLHAGLRRRAGLSGERRAGRPGGACACAGRGGTCVCWTLTGRPRWSAA